MSENTQAAPAAKAPAARFGGKGLNIGIVVAAVVTVAGLALWGMQLSGGLVQTGMRNFDSWGLYITMFMFFVGLSAGGLIVASSASVFHVADYKKVALPAVILSGFIFDINSMPDALQYLTLAIPARHFNTALQTVFLAGDIWPVFLPRMAFMLGLGAAFLVITYRKLVKRLDV